MCCHRLMQNVIVVCKFKDRQKHASIIHQGTKASDCTKRKHTCQTPSALGLQSTAGLRSKTAFVADNMGLIQNDPAPHCRDAPDNSD